ncbi:MAG: NRDE family protein [Oleiphilaceae bacterium]|nr:NRDE family protein [Oleiphilaceae bacterium]
MCLILAALGQHSDYPLVVAANRDEFYQRPTSPMHWWQNPEVLAGKDDRSGGTWLAVNPAGEVTAVTNVRDGIEEPGWKSRGELPLRALSTDRNRLDAELREERHRFGGFNLLDMNVSSGWHFSNRDTHPGRHLHRGLYGVSNHLLQSPWPKLIKLRQSCHQVISQEGTRGAEPLHQALIDTLRDDTPAPDHLLPDTGVGLETERFLSPAFIRSQDYGTRATTIVTVHKDGWVRVTEQAWGPWGQPGAQISFQWRARA